MFYIDKKLGVDLPVLTDEVRGVMDRMIASEEQIIESQRVYGMESYVYTQEKWHG